MEVIVTGGSGFIASYLVTHLLVKGHKVKILDLNEPRIKHKNLEFARKSILNNIAEDIKGADAVFHFAALLGVDNSDKRPLDTMKVNLEGSVNVFKSSLDAGVKRMIVGVSSMYGHGEKSNWFVAILRKKGKKKEPITIFGNGNQTRCFTYV